MTQAYGDVATKFTINKNSKISLTESGNTFVNSVAKKQVNGKLRLITKKEAYVWMEAFIKLSDRKAQESPDFTPVNNFYNHLMLCDQLLADLLIQNGEPEQTPLKEKDQIPENRKKKLLAELENLRSKLRRDIDTLVDPRSSENLIVLIDFYDKALKETLDIN